MIDLTNVALRRSPHEKFEGPILQSRGGMIHATIEGDLFTWSPDGSVSIGDHPLDLIPYAPAPVARKWLKCNHGRLAPMIERPPVDALVEALRRLSGGSDVARDALAAWEAGL